MDNHSNKKPRSPRRSSIGHHEFRHTFDQRSNHSDQRSDQRSDAVSLRSIRRFRNYLPNFPLPNVNNKTYDDNTLHVPSLTTTTKSIRKIASINSLKSTVSRSRSRSFTKYLQAKALTYSRALDGARLRGEWDGNQSSGTGKDLSWSELIRKYMKHNAHDQITPSVANIEQQIRSALMAFYKEEGFSDVQHLSDSAGFKGIGKTVFEPVLPLKKSGTGWSGEGFAAAIDQLDGLRSSARESLEKLAIASLQAFALFASGQDENAVELLHDSRFLEEVDRESLKSGQVEGEYTLAMIMMGFTVYGMANERLFEKRKDQGYIPFALAGYASTIDLHEGFRGGKAAKALRGLPPDEIERWGEKALYRNALFSVRNASTPTFGLNALRAYQANAGRWTANFRTPQRLVIFRTYLAVLNQSLETGTYKSPPTGVQLSKEDCRSAAYQSSVMAIAASRVEVRDFESERKSRLEEDQKVSIQTISAGKTIGQSGPRTTSKRRPAPWREISPSSSWWTNEFLTAEKTAAECLQRTSEFPRAGRVNKAALELADELIKGWRVNGERGGFEADDLVEILYTLSRFTFHSQRISRLLFTVLVAAENYQEAQKALELYIQIVDKAREGDAADAAGLVEEAKRRENGKEGPTKVIRERKDEDEEDEKIALKSEEAKQSAQEIHLDHDSDPIYINTLLDGAYILVRYLNNAKEGYSLACKANDLLYSNDKTGRDHLLLAKLKRILGASRAARAREANDALTRPKEQEEAISLFKQSLTYDDQSSETYYQLAQLQSEMNDTTSAVRSARRAVELEPAQVDYWHLLALLVSAQKDFRGALRVAEEGLAEAEDDDEADQAKNEPVLTNGNHATNDVKGSTRKRTVLLSVDFHPSVRQRSESILRLMITHNALEELVEGAQAAIEAQREIFEFFHKRLASNKLTQRQVLPSSAAIGNARGGGTMNGNGVAGIDGHSHNHQQNGHHHFSHFLHGPGQSSNRFHSLTGLGQSGSSHNLWNGPQNALSSKNDGGAFGSNGISAMPATTRDDLEEGNESSINNAQIREKYRLKEETELLCTLWLMTAATFRRNGNLQQCRVAIQEAERVDPGNGDVWLQLALWFERQPTGHIDEPSSGLAIQSLYKAISCNQNHVGAAIHLARIFISHPLDPQFQNTVDSKSGLPSLKDVASPLPQTTENFHASRLAGELLSKTQSRKISAPTPTSESMKNEKEEEGNDALAKEKKTLASLSMAEGLLVTLTQNYGWQSPEAWLYLSKVMQQTSRPERQRQCLEYALQLERNKPIRPLFTALQPGC